MVSYHRFSGSENTILPSEYSFEYSIYFIQAHKGFILCQSLCGFGILSMKPSFFLVYRLKWCQTKGFQGQRALSCNHNGFLNSHYTLYIILKLSKM